MGTQEKINRALLHAAETWPTPMGEVDHATEPVVNPYGSHVDSAKGLLVPAVPMEWVREHLQADPVDIWVAPTADEIRSAKRDVRYMGQPRG